MAFEGALLALAQVLNLRGYVVEVNVFQSPFTNGGGINERPSVVVAFIQRLREFGLIGRLRFRLAHAVNLSPRHSQPQLRLKTSFTNRGYATARGAVRLYLWIKN